MTHQVYNANTAPEAARAALTTIEKGFGFIPNMLGAMAGAPAVLEAYQTGGALFDKTSLNATERQIVMLTTSAENGCEYCMAPTARALPCKRSMRRRSTPSARGVAFPI
ncbi:carboxymuconolactone decarboxylase family protein (plasmid) [Methylocystis sp. MJC1]|nr:carboxymuconolactone decarboxylase family protein [Methylocystis sp. MJC1]